jgi:hypothetical protein
VQEKLRIGRYEANGRVAIYCLTALRMAGIFAGVLVLWLTLTHQPGGLSWLLGSGSARGSSETELPAAPHSADR